MNKLLNNKIDESINDFLINMHLLGHENSI